MAEKKKADETIETFTEEATVETAVETTETVTTAPVPAPVVDKKKSQEKWLNERVPFFAFQDNDKYKDDIVVGINGYNYVIQRGKQVSIPRFVFMAIMDSERQRIEANKHSQGLADKFYNESVKRGMA